MVRSPHPVPLPEGEGTLQDINGITESGRDRALASEALADFQGLLSLRERNKVRGSD
jgi:hypothetical protein